MAILFGNNNTARTELIIGARGRALAAAKQALMDSEAAERLFYKEKSYYYCKEHGIRYVTDDDTALGEDEELIHPAAPASPVAGSSRSPAHGPLSMRSRSSDSPSGGGSGGRFQSIGEALDR